jgi:hypothetical protein
MFTAKDIIIDAYDRTGIFPNATDGLPGEFVTMGKNLLRGLLSQYNIRNYLTFTQQSVNAIADTEITIGTNDITRGIINTVEAPNCSTIQKVYWNLGNTVNSETYSEMKFIPFIDFERYSSGDQIYTWRQINDLQFKLNFTSTFTNKPMLIHYNEKIVVELNSSYALSDDYRELWTLGLSDQLLTYYPRKDDNMKNYVTTALASAISNITAKNAANRLIMANTFSKGSSFAYANSGSFLYGG